MSRKREKRQPATAEMQAVRRHIAERAEVVAQSYLSAMQPLYYHDNRKRLQVEGTGICLQIGHRRFLLTAAHVLDAPYELFVSGEPETVVNDGRYWCTEATAGGPTSADIYDVAVVPLASEYGAGLGWLGTDDLALREVPNLDPPMRTKYLVIGFPHTPFKRKRVLTPFKFTGLPTSPEGYARRGFSPNSHLMVEFDRKHVIGIRGERTATDPVGTSGGAMIRFDSVQMRPAAKDRLVALITGGDPAGAFIWGTRVDVAIEIIRRHCPHLFETAI